MPRPASPPHDRLANAWHRYGTAASVLGVAYLVIAAAGKLAYALPRLVRDVEPWSAIDLKYRHNEVAAWFTGEPVYGVVDGAVYPPASHVLLWPLLGWLPLDAARLLWAASTLAAAAIIALLAYHICRPAPPLQRLLMAGLAFAAYPLQMSVFVGQMGVHVAALALAGAFVLVTARPSWQADVLAAALLTASLVKPTLSVPLVLAALVLACRVRPMLLVGAFYTALTAVAAAVQPDDLLTLLREWLAVSGGRVSFLEGVPSVHLLLAWLGLEDWTMVASLFLLTATGAWLWHRRDADPWLVLGAAAIVARFWTHSRAYDDALLLVAALALFRAALLTDGRTRRLAALLFVGAWAVLLTPTWAFYNLPPATTILLHAGHTALWLAAFVFVVAVTQRRDSLRGAPLS
jgi:hypothetical protein